MQSPELLLRQCAGIHAIFHSVADDLSDAEWTRRILPDTNLPGFDLWHVARTQDWALNTLVQGVPEIISDPSWAGKGALTTPGIGVGLSLSEADRLAQDVTKADIILYANTVHERLIAWLASIDESTLDRIPDIQAHLQGHPEYLTAVMRAEVPWLEQQPAVLRCLAPALGHVRDHLAVVDLLKRVGRR